ncbi:MAG: hypothetical protein OXD01_08850 [Gammaproteobacteria bacterium]|nr:hypothetical protein [Gammaproteobacteria bacterium]
MKNLYKYQSDKNPSGTTKLINAEIGKIRGSGEGRTSRGMAHSQMTDLWIPLAGGWSCIA